MEKAHVKHVTADSYMNLHIRSELEWPAIHVRTVGTRLHCRISSAAGPRRPWVTFANSLLTDCSSWHRQASVLAGELNVLLYDQRGHGRTPPVPGACNLGLLAADLLAVWDALGIERSHLVGISMGALTAAAVASRAPDRCAKVVFADAATETTSGHREAWQQRIDLVTSRGLEAIVEPTLARWMAPGFAQRNPEGLQHLQHMMRNTSQQGFLSCAAALRDADIAPLVQKLPAHTLLIAGEHDAAVTGMLRELKARRPAFGWTEVPGAGHLPNLEQPEAFNRALVEFLL